MRKGLWKRTLALGLAAVLGLGLAACGNKEEDQAGNANSILAKQYVYSYEKVDFGDYGDSVSISKMEYKGGRVYALLDIYTYTGGGAAARYGAAASKAAVTADNQAALDDAFAVDPEVDAEVDTEIGEEITGEVVQVNVKKVVSFLPDGSDLQSFDLDMGEQKQNGYSWLNALTFGADNVCAMRESWYEDYSDPENPISENRQEIVCWDNNGAQKWAFDIADMLQTEDHYYYVNSLKCLEDGRVYVVCGGDGTRILILDQEGNLLEDKTVGNSERYINYTFIKEDGSILFISANDDWTKMYANTYDLATETMGEEVELPDTIMSYSLYEGSDTDLVLTNNSGVYTLNIGETEIKQIMSFVNSDLDAMWVNYVAVIDGEHMVVTYSDMVDYKQQIAVMTKVNEEDIPDKKVLVLGGSYIGSDARRRIFNFNKTSEKYRITIRDYSTYNTGSDYTACYTQLNNDIISGNMPDIMIVNNQLDIDNYISKGLLADVGSLIEKDEELSQEEYLENVFDAYAVDGKLYHVIPIFRVNTIIGKQSLLGDINGWNMEEFLAVMEQMPEGTSSFGEYTRESFFSMVLQYCGSDFVDASTGKCSFDSPEFIRMLEFAKTLPEEITYGEDYDWSKWETQYREETTLLMPVTIYSFSDLNYQFYGQFGEEVSFVGFPNEDRNGSVITASESYVLSARSEDLEGAWEYVRYYLTDEYQSTINYGLPVNKEYFKALAQKATERPYYTDENGEKIEYDDYVYINGESVILPPMSQEQVDRIVSFVEGVSRRSYSNNDILNIINEDVAPFFAGQKTAEDVASIIQNRVQVFVNEKR